MKKGKQRSKAMEKSYTPNSEMLVADTQSNIPFSCLAFSLFSFLLCIYLIYPKILLFFQSFSPFIA